MNGTLGGNTLSYSLFFLSFFFGYFLDGLIECLSKATKSSLKFNQNAYTIEGFSVECRK